MPEPLPSLILLPSNASKKGFAYSGLDTFFLDESPEPGQGMVIRLHFGGVPAWEVELSGRNLDTLYCHIGDHRVRWVQQRAAERDFMGKGETVVTGITITKVEA